MSSALFMFGKNEIKVFGVIDGIEDGKDCSSRISNYRMSD